MIFKETKILVHFYKKFQDIIIIFHDFPWLSRKSGHPENIKLLKGFVQLWDAHKAVLISESSTVSLTPATAATPYTRRQCIKSWCASLPLSFCLQQTMLLSDMGNTCKNLPRILHSGLMQPRCPTITKHYGSESQKVLQLLWTSKTKRNHTSPSVHSIWPRKSSSDTWGVLLSMSYTAKRSLCTSSK